MYLKNSDLSYFDTNFSYQKGSVSLISADEFNYIFKESKEESKIWDEFQKYHNSATIILNFSRIGFNESKTKALLVAGSYYGLDYNKENLFNFGGEHSLFFFRKRR